MVDTNRLLTQSEELQIEALKRGASPEEASLKGKLSEVREIPSLGSFEQPSGVPEAEVQPTAIMAERASERASESSASISVLDSDPEEEEEIGVFSDTSGQAPFRSEEYNQTRALDLLTIKIAIDPNIDRFQAFHQSFLEVSNSPDIDELFEVYKGQFADSQNTLFLQQIEGEIASGSITPENINEVVEEADEIRQQYAGRIGEQRAFIDTFGNPDLSEIARSQRENKLYAYSILRDWTEENESFGSKFLDWMGVIFVPDFVKDASDLVDGNVFTSLSHFKDKVGQFRQLSPEAQREEFDSLFPKLVEAYDNNYIKIGGAVATFFDEDYRSVINFNASFDIFDVVTLGAASLPLKTIKGAIQGTKTAHKLKEVGALDEAAEAVSSAVDSVAENAIVGDKVAQAMSRSPYNWSDTIIGVDSVEDISAETIKQAERLKREIRNEVQAPISNLLAEESELQLKALKQIDKERFQTEVLKEVEGASEEGGILYKNAKIIETSDTGFKVKFEIDDPKSDRLPLNATREVEYRIDNAGIFQEVNTKKTNFARNILGKYFLTPELRLAGISNDLVAEVTEIGRNTARLRDALTDRFKTINKTLSRKERESVNELLLAGDQAKKNWTLDDLLSGKVELESGTRRYSFKEAEAYYKNLAFFKQTKNFWDHSIRSSLNLRGAKQLTYTRRGPQGEGVITKALGIPLKDFRGVNLDADELILAPQIGNGKFINVDKLNTSKEALQAEGYTLVRLIQPFKSGNSPVRYGFMKHEGRNGSVSFGELPLSILKDTGDWYVPRNYRKGLYYVKDVAGTGRHQVAATLTVARSKKLAQEWRDNFVQQQRDAGTSEGEIITPEVFRDRDIGKLDSLVEDANRFGGLVTGARKTDTLTLTDGSPVPRLDLGAATQKYIESTAEVMAISEYRMGAVQRYRNSANLYAKNVEKKTKPAVDPLGDWRTDEINIDSPSIRSAFEQTREYIKDQLGIWSGEEKAFNRFMMDGIEHMNANYRVSDKVHDTAVALAHTSPFKNLRALTFSLHLGWFNPRQLYIQAQNASLAASIHPDLAPQAITRSMAMRTIMFAPESHWNKLAKLAAPAVGLSPEDLVQNLKDFKRSGFMQSIVNIADYDIVVNGFSPGTMNAFKRLQQRGLLAYREGELSSRLNSWNIAREKWKRDNPGKKFDIEASRVVNRDSDRLHLNMQKTNAAWWQKNPITGMSTQFLQVQAKLAERLLPAALGRGGGPEAWTGKEAAQVMAGQILFYGTLGVPFAEETVTNLMEFFDTDPAVFAANNPNWKELIDDGMVGVLGSALGAENTFGGDTASVIAAFDDNLPTALIRASANFFSGNYRPEDGFIDLSAGPTANTIRRGGDSLQRITQALSDLWFVPSLETFKGSSLKTLDALGDLTSTWNNASKVIEAYNMGLHLSRKGNVIFNQEDLENINLTTAIARAFGIPTDFETLFYNLKEGNFDEARRITDKKETFKKMAREFHLTQNLDLFMRRKAYLFATEDEAVVIQIRDDVAAELTRERGKSQLDKEVNTFITNIIRSPKGFQQPSGIGEFIENTNQEEQ